MIDYKLIQASIEYYESLHFKHVEAPWAVSEAICNITLPEGKMPFKLVHNNKCLVGSAEQSFLYLYLKGFLPKGQFQAVTPCFRYEPFDQFHSKYFIKNELIKTDVVSYLELVKILDHALGFYKKYIPDAHHVETEDGFDIVVDGKELGSYGIRECEFLKWIYGTGCAEPRLSTLMQTYGISH